MEERSMFPGNYGDSEDLKKLYYRLIENNRKIGILPHLTYESTDDLNWETTLLHHTCLFDKIGDPLAKLIREFIDNKTTPAFYNKFGHHQIATKLISRKGISTEKEYTELCRLFNPDFVFTSFPD